MPPTGGTSRRILDAETLTRSRALVLVSILVVLAVAFLSYTGAEIDKALTECGADPPNHVNSTSQATSIEAGWSIRQGGFYCSFSDASDQSVRQIRLGQWL